MKHGICLVAVLLAASQGCTLEPREAKAVEEEPFAEQEASPPEVERVFVESDVCAEARVMERALDQAYREVIACGDLQSLTARGLAARLIVSAPETEPETRSLLDTLTGAEQWSLAPDGTWSAKNMATGDFVLRVRKPDGTLITVDAFRFESYLAGVRVEQELTFDEMLDAPDVTNTWRFHFDGPGPLYDVLARDGELESPIVFRASLEEVQHLAFPDRDAELVPPDLGPFDPLLDLRFETFLDSRAREDAGEVTVLAAMAPESVRNLISGVGEGLVVESIDATHDLLDIDVTQNLEYRLGEGLTGTIAYQMSAGDTIAVGYAVRADDGSTTEAFTCGLDVPRQRRRAD